MKFKDKVVEDRFKDLNPQAQKIAIEMDQWAMEKYKIELTITSTVSTLEEDKLLKRQSDTHRTRRAWDVRTRDLPDEFIAELISYFNKKYANKFGAIVGGKPSLIVYRPHGTGPHLHIQLNRKYALKELTYGKEN
jgi:hypothetical protein